MFHYFCSLFFFPKVQSSHRAFCFFFLNLFTDAAAWTRVEMPTLFKLGRMPVLVSRKYVLFLRDGPFFAFVIPLPSDLLPAVMMLQPTGPAACNKASGAQVGDDSCVDNDDVGASCRNLVDGVVGTSSCLGTRACADTTSDSLIVADNSCQGTDACKDTGADKRRQETTVIGTGSCQGVKACEGFAGVSIGDNSCNCFECCACWSWKYPGAPFLPDEIPSNSCNTPGECCPLSSSPSDFPSSSPSEQPSSNQPSSSPTPCGKKCITFSPTASPFPTASFVFPSAPTVPPPVP